MAADHPRPERIPSDAFDMFVGGEDPAAIHRAAHETAALFLARAREAPTDEEHLDRFIRLADEHGIDTVAALWARVSPRSLPGALWHLYLVRAMVNHDPARTSLEFQRGMEHSPGIHPVVVGAPMPAGPQEIRDLIDTVMRGAFVGDFGTALDRTSAFCWITSRGATSFADDADEVGLTHPGRSRRYDARAARLADIATDLTTCARLWRRGALT